MGWDKKHSAKREWNFFICSIYRGENYNTYKRSVDWWGRPIVNKCYATLHLGIAGNFFIVKYREEGCQTNLEPTIY